MRTIGHIVAVKPQAGNEEGTNCRFRKVSKTDIHIAIVGEAGDGERNSVVVETTPRLLKIHPKWGKKTLDQYSNQDIPIRISGWLMLDPDHRNHLNKYRHTLWHSLDSRCIAGRCQKFTTQRFFPFCPNLLKTVH